MTSQTLDPQDWPAFRAQSHAMLDDMLDFLETIRQRPVWQPIPPEIRAQLAQALPVAPTPLSQVHQDFLDYVLPYSLGNTHPGFFGWAHGGGAPVGMLAEMLAGGLNANLGGRDHAPVLIERQILAWVREIFSFPPDASGLMVTGTSLANLIAVVTARTHRLGASVRRSGLGSQAGALTAYAAHSVHGCLAKAMEIAGHGHDQLRLIATDAAGRLLPQALSAAIHHDRAMGFIPFLVIGTAGSVDIGAIDPLNDLADIAKAEDLWFHVDGAFGAFAVLVPALKPLLAGLERAQSLAFDFHKWAQAPYDAGFVLIRDPEAHRAAFATQPAYLTRTTRGMAAGNPWLCDFGPDLSRGFRALKIWYLLRVHGLCGVQAIVAECCRLARYLARLIEEQPELELLAPVALNIVCFRFLAPDPDPLNADIAADLQEMGIAAPSTTRLPQGLAIRAAILNHRTSETEIETLVTGVLARGRARLEGR